MISVFFSMGVSSHAATQVLHPSHDQSLQHSLISPSLFFYPLAMSSSLASLLRLLMRSVTVTLHWPHWHLSATPQNKDGLIELLFTIPCQGPATPHHLVDLFHLSLYEEGACFGESNPHPWLCCFVTYKLSSYVIKNAEPHVMHEIIIHIRSKIPLPLQRWNGVIYYILHIVKVL